MKMLKCFLFPLAASASLLFKEGNWLKPTRIAPGAPSFSLTENYTITLSAPKDLLEDEFWANEGQWDFSQGATVPIKSVDEQFDGVGNVVYNPRKMREELILRLFAYFSKLDKQQVRDIVTESGLAAIEKIMRDKDLKELSKDQRELCRVLKEEASLDEEQLSRLRLFPRGE